METKKAVKRTSVITKQKAKTVKQAPKEKIKIVASIPRPEAKKTTMHKLIKPVKTDERTSYSEKELAEFRILITEKLGNAKNNYELLRSNLSYTNEHGTEDTSPTFKVMEDGSDMLTKEETANLALRQEKFIQNLQNALIRIENKIYGICRVTGKLIPRGRLLSVPHATLSIDAKLEQQFNY